MDCTLNISSLFSRQLTIYAPAKPKKDPKWAS
jgi:hypothetical protein